jgi:UDP-glucose 4-epimerase
MRYLVTGGAGFIGSNIVDKLIELGNKVTVIDNESSDAHEQFYWNENAKNYKYDICDYDSIRHLFTDVDVVFHLAAESRIQPAIHNPIYATTVNTVGTCNILQAAREANVHRVVYSSTSAAYGLSNTPPLREDMPRDCLNPYSISKCAGEDLCKMYTDLYGLETVAFRYFNVYGNRQPIKGQYAPVIGLFLRQKEEGLPMTIIGTGEQRRDFTHVSDVVEANLLAADLKNKRIVGQLFNIGTGINHSILDLVEMIGGERAFLAPRLAEAMVSLADNSKAKHLLKWNPQTCLKNWIENERR